MNTEPTLRLIGYCRSDHEPWWPDAHDFVDAEWDANVRRMVADHLDAATPTPWEFAGYSDCRFCGEPNGTGERTDGTYVWPEGLAHYVTEHNVRLPEEFVAHVSTWLDGWPEELVDDTWWRQQQSL